jgi:aspartate aminotransferase-like enzyme
MPRFYLDLRSHRDAAKDGQTPFTPAIAVVYQVDEGVRLMQQEGAAGIFARHEAVRGRLAGRPPGAGVRAVRRPALRVADR